MHSPATIGENAALQLIGMRALLLTKGTSAAIALGDEESMVCEASIGRSAPPLGCQLDVSSGLSGECVRTAMPLRCDDAENDPRVDAESCGLLGIRSILAAPILSGTGVAGLLEVFSPEPNAFDDNCLGLIARLAQSAVPAPPTYTPPNLLVDTRAGASRVLPQSFGDFVSSAPRALEAHFPACTVLGRRVRPLASALAAILSVAGRARSDDRRAGGSG